MQLTLPAIAAVTRRPSFRVIAGLGITQVIGWGTTFSALAILGTPIGHDLGLSREWVFGGISVMLLVAALIAPRSGRLVDRLGARPIMTVGSLVAVLAMLVLSRANGLASYLVGWSIAGVATPLMLNNAAMPGLVQVVGANARVAITRLMLITGLTSTVFLPVNSVLLALVGWRGAFLVFAALHALVCAPLHWLVLQKGSGHEPQAGSVTHRAPPPEGALLPEQRRSAFALLALWMCTEGLISWGFTVQVIDILAGSGLSRAQAVGVWAIVGPCQTLARIIEILGHGRHSILSTTLGATLLVNAAFLLVLPLGVSVTTSIVFCLLMGLGNGLSAIARNTLPLALFGAKSFGAYMGLLMVPQNIVNAAAPVVFAFVMEVHGPASGLWVAASSAWTGFVAVVAMVTYCRRATRARGIEV